MSTTRYWITRNEILSGKGFISEAGYFVFDDELGQRTIKGYHFESKDAAFRDFCNKADGKIAMLKKDVEILRAQL
jgi:hypothetical protein